MNMTRELSKLEKAYLLSHINDYEPSVSQFIIKNKEDWANDIKGFVQYKDLCNGNIPGDLPEPLCSSLKALNQYRVSRNIFPFLCELNAHCKRMIQYKKNMVDNSLLRRYMECALFQILVRKLEAVEIIHRLESPDFATTQTIEYMAYFIRAIEKMLIHGIKKGIDTRTIAEEVARNLYLFHRLQLRTETELPISKTCECFFRYIHLIGGDILLPLIEESLDRYGHEPYLPIGNEMPFQVGKLGFDDINPEGTENYVNNLAVHRTRPYSFFGKYCSTQPVGVQDVRRALDMEEADISSYTHEFTENVSPNSISFTIPEKDLMCVQYENGDRCGDVIIMTESGDCRHILTLNGRSEKYLLFKLRDNDDMLYGIDCSGTRPTKSMCQISINPNYTYEMVAQGDLL